MRVKCLFLFVLRFSISNGQNCRGEVTPRSCERVCDNNGDCAIRAALLLPMNTDFDVSVSAVEPVIDLALQDPLVKEVFPPWLRFETKSYDVTNCDAAYAIISSIDAYNDCTHVFFGPACDYALASVARIAKFLGNSGTPLVTTGGFTFDFVMPKQDCDDEYFMLVRTGVLGFMDLGYFLIDIMRHYNWQQLLLINEPEAQTNIAGRSTCHLMVKTFANFLKKEDIVYSPWDTTSDGGRNYTENLKFYLGYKYTSKFEWSRVVLLYETAAYPQLVGEDGGWLAASSIHRALINDGIIAFGREFFDYQNVTEILLESVGNDYSSKCCVEDITTLVLSF